MSTKRERLLDWIRNGDPKDVPVLMGPHVFEVASAKLGKDQCKVNWTEAIDIAEQTGTHLLACVSSPLLFSAIPFLDDIQIEEQEETLPDGTPKRTKRIKTPEGTLTQIQEFPKDKGSYHREFFVKDEQDIPAFAYLIRKTTEAIIKNPAIRQKVSKDIAARKDLIRNQFPTMLWPFVPAVELTSCYYMGQETAIYLLYDQRELMEELMDRHWEMTKVWLELGREHEIDIYGYAINGYEWLSPDIYERYMIPQAKRLNEVVAEQGKLSWLHTCGKMKKIAEAGIYQQIKVNVFESLSMPPTGDIENMRETRSQIGHNIATRGGINCELLYSDDLETLRKRTEYVLDSVEGYKHMIGDTNSSYPSYPWKNIQLVIDIVREHGRLFE